MNMPTRVLRPPTAFALSTDKQKRPRKKSDAHLRWIRSLPCLVTGVRGSVEAAHIRYGDWSRGKRETGMAEKPDDRWAVPLSAEKHREQHQGDERAFWVAHGIDPIAVALALYGVSGDDEAGEVIVREARR